MVELVAQGVNAFSDLFSMNASFIIYTIITKPDKIFNVRRKSILLTRETLTSVILWNSLYIIKYIKFSLH